MNARKTNNGKGNEMEDQRTNIDKIKGYNPDYCPECGMKGVVCSWTARPGMGLDYLKCDWCGKQWTRQT
jgi:formate dehydrogenase maturation protein FdhE